MDTGERECVYDREKVVSSVWCVVCAASVCVASDDSRV